MSERRSDPILPARARESDAESRLREALERHLNAARACIDAAIRLRVAPKQAQRWRGNAVSKLGEAGAAAMTALAFAEQPQPADKEAADAR